MAFNPYLALVDSFMQRSFPIPTGLLGFLGYNVAQAISKVNGIHSILLGIEQYTFVLIFLAQKKRP